MPAFSKENQILIHDHANSRWLHFSNPHRLISANRIEEVSPALDHIEKLVAEHDWYAAGFLAYEAAAAFDPALCTHSLGNFPLLWFGLYPKPGRLELPRPDFTAYSLGELIPSIREPAYRRAIAKIRDFIHSGDTYQVNYTFRLQADFSGDPWHLFLAMVHAQPDGYSAWVDIGRYAVCSASPELFFRLEGDRLICKPMKGTAKRGRTLQEDKSNAAWLRSSEKNRAENLMIVDMIRNDLGRIAEVGTVEVASLFDVERHPTLWQMTSTVKAKSQAGLREILCALFPCASITGAPKFRTTEIIAELESIARGLYTGCLGFFAPGPTAQFNVAIRTAVVDRVAGKAFYGAGGGIVWDSDSGEEYTEALLKSRVFTDQRPSFSLLETMLWTPEDSFFLLEQHLRRLRDSAEYFSYPLNLGIVRAELKKKAGAFAAKPQRVRITVSESGQFEIESVPMDAPESDQPVRLRLAKDPVDSGNIFLYHKTTYRGIYESAMTGFSDCDDVLLWNERGELTESCIANLVVELEGRLLTPPVNSGLLPGTFRDWLIGEGTITECEIRPGDLAHSTNLFLINSVRKWRKAILVG
jgi:para-aminobenzoate synthetase / 4-amino-4-deoxychorismate lyase